jgi:hypothetical protein
MIRRTTKESTAPDDLERAGSPGSTRLPPGLSMRCETHSDLMRGTFHMLFVDPMARAPLPDVMSENHPQLRKERRASLRIPST